MTEQDIRRRMAWDEKEPEEIEDAVAEWADAENDRLAEEEYLKGKANEQA